VRALLAPHAAERVPGLPPFQGGAAGYLAYDWGRSLERLPSARYDDLALPDVVLGVYDWVLAWDHDAAAAWLISTGLPESRSPDRVRRAERRAAFVRERLGNVAPTGDAWREEPLAPRGGGAAPPKTGTFFAHKPINEKIELGISFSNDNIGDVVNENNIYADFAYVLPVGLESKLSLGLKAGFTFFSANFDGFVLQSGDVSTDVAFNENISKTFPNLGIGAFFFTDNYYLGLSAPNMLSTTHLETENGVKVTGVQSVHYFFTGGYVFDINEDLKFKPAFMGKAVKGSPLALDITANVLFNEKLEAGLGYRVGDAVSALVNFRITPELRIGYAYDYTTTNLGSYNSGSHEIFILFDIDLFGFRGGYNRSPRFF
jgi:type IX secretion system PorP/SprF family membrane protein